MRSVIDQVLQAAAANGVTGVSAPVGDRPTRDDVAADDRGAGPAHPAAEAALLSGDLDTPSASTRAALRPLPADADAILGLAQAKLLKRTARSIRSPRGAAAAAIPTTPPPRLWPPTSTCWPATSTPRSAA